MSDTIDHQSITEALVAFQAEVGTVAKDADNPFFKSKYADLPAVKAAAQPILAKHGLAVVQEPSYVVIGEKVHDTLITSVIHAKSGAVNDFTGFRSTMILKPVKNDPQAQGSAITYARRYAFMAVLGLVADDDDDGNAASGKSRQTRTRQKANEPSGDGVDQAALNDAVAAVKKAAKDAGVTLRQVNEHHQSEYDESLVESRNIDNLKATAKHFTMLSAAQAE